MTGKVFDFPSFEADCTGCAALCCVALHFDNGPDFALDKDAGTPCPNLMAESFGCQVHSQLAELGFSGCIKFDCKGAGQRTTQEVFGGITWRETPDMMRSLIDSFRHMRQLHDALEILQLLGHLPLDTCQNDLRNSLLERFTTPDTGWTPQSLAALENSGAFAAYKSAMPQFASAMQAANTLAEDHGQP